MHRRRRFVDAVEQAAAQHCKNEILWLGSVRRQHQIPDDLLPVGLDLVLPVRSVRDLNELVQITVLHLDLYLSICTQVTRTVSRCFTLLRQIRSISRSVSRSVLQSLIMSLVFSRLDYGSATRAGLPARLLDRLQSELNAAACLVWSTGLGSMTT